MAGYILAISFYSDSTRMFKQQIDSIGKFQQITIYNEAANCSFSFLPEFGAYLTSLKFDNSGKAHEVIDGYTTEQEILENKKYKSAFLLPYPNRIEDGKYSFEGKAYQMHINETALNNNLHGFTDFYHFEVQDIRLESAEASVRLSHHYQGQHTGFPFPFEVEIIYTLTAQGQFNCAIHIQNTGTTKMPIGTGWHPYFRLTDGVGNHLLQFPALEKVEVDDRMIPTGTSVAYDDFKALCAIGSTNLDTCFRLKVEDETASTILSNSAQTFQIEVYQETGEGKFNFLQVYTPPERDAVAIEPMTCNVNAFNNQDGIIVLNANEKFEGNFGVNCISITKDAKTVAQKVAVV